MTALELATALNERINSKTYLPVWLASDMATLLEAIRANAEPVTGNWLEKMHCAPDIIQYLRPADGEIIDGSFWEPPFESRAIYVVDGGVVDIQTADDQRRVLTVPEGWNPVLSVKRIYHAQTTARMIQLLK